MLCQEKRLPLVHPPVAATLLLLSGCDVTILCRVTHLRGDAVPQYPSGDAVPQYPSADAVPQRTFSE